MFEDSLIESAGKLKTKARYTAVLSFGMQILVIGILVLIPLIYTEALPAKAMMTMLVAPPPPPPPPPPPAQVVKVQKITTEIVDGALRTPTKIPEKIKKIVEEEAPPPATTMGVPGAIGGVPGGSAGGVLGGVLSAANATPPKVQPQRIRVSSGVQAGLLLNKVQPVYPPIAKAARVQGKVILQAQISKNGTIEGLKVISGHPMLTQSALDAVSRWRYKPYILNGEPVEVDTQVEVTFTLQGGS
jgi:periplasmic protein TonB